MSTHSHIGYPCKLCGYPLEGEQATEFLHILKANKLNIVFERPNKADYLTTNQFEYQEKINQYYKDLEDWCDYIQNKHGLK